jgi:hypothetical protein
MTHALLCVLLVFQAFEISTGDIFHRYLTKRVLLDLFDIAERELKIFVYPIPNDVERYRDENPADWQECEGRTFELHFCIEELFIRYLQDVRDNFENYPHLKTNFLTNTADSANAFVIDHTW